ncbi:MAG: type II toxin-antitoxin system VapC family toxin [Tepidiformaceae bacterium]
MIDASVAAQWYLPEPNTEFALRLLQRENVDLIAPSIMVAEMANVAWKAFMSRAMTEQQAVDMLDRFRSAPVRLVPTEELVEYALDLAVRHRHAVYDCLYLALALREDCFFVTADREFYGRVSPGLPNNVVWVEDIPA